MYKKGLALNNLQWLTCHKIQPTNHQGLEYAVLPEKEYPSYDTQLGSVEYPFINITPRSTLIRSGSTC